MPYNLLSEPIRRYIRDKKWENFRPIQSAAVVKIITTKENYILASRTASGKTEAAFLPIISLLDFDEPGVQVLYISPLIALINDQFIRVEDLCKYLDVSITKWHGDAKVSQKEKLIKNPSGILLITPESIEAMFANKPYNVSKLFSNLKFIVIDEIHSFLGTERGVQLKSLISRLKENISSQVRFVALSATIGDFEEAKSFFGEPEITKVLRDSTKKNIHIEYEYFYTESDEMSNELINSLYEKTKYQKALIFPNSRGNVEEISVKLKKKSKTKEGHKNYFAHHSSINKELREDIEKFAKNNSRENFSIACTSTLELGIDIGSVDLVVQVDSTFSVSSLMQRLGRSGRKEGATSNLLLYSTNPWTFLQSLACVSLLSEGFTEPIKEIPYPIDILFHQILSILKETSGINIKNLMDKITKNIAFKNISKQDCLSLIKSMIDNDYIEDLKKELILGIKSEPLVNDRSFYSVFKTEENLSVIYQNKEIGDISYSPQVKINENIFLASKIWKIIDLDFYKNKIYVENANDGKKPKFEGSGGNIHKKIREKMFELLLDNSIIENCTKEGLDEINDLRKKFSNFKIINKEVERPVIVSLQSIQLFTFTGTKINQTIDFLLRSIFEDFSYCESKSLFELKTDFITFEKLIEKLKVIIENFKIILEAFLLKNEFIYSKWGNFLDNHYKKKIALSNYFDIYETKDFLSSLKLVYE